MRLNRVKLTATRHAGPIASCPNTARVDASQLSAAKPDRQRFPTASASTNPVLFSGWIANRLFIDQDEVQRLLPVTRVSAKDADELRPVQVLWSATCREGVAILETESVIYNSGSRIFLLTRVSTVRSFGNFA